MLADKPMKQLDLNLLKVFEALYIERNMTQAAKVLFVSPSAISHAVKRLRESLDDELFVRKGSNMEPTSSCRQIAPEIIDLLAKLRSVLQSCGEFELAQSHQTFTLAIHEALEALVLPSIQEAVAQQAPFAQIKSVKLNRENVARQLSNRQVDVVIDVARALKMPIKHSPLSDDNFAILMSKQYAPNKKMSEAEYFERKHIAVSNRSDGNVVEDIAFLQRGLNRKIQTRCQNYHTAKALLAGNDYLLTLPSMIAKELVDDSLVIVELPIQLPKIATHLYWHQNTEQDPAIQWLRDVVHTAFISR